ncbi:unnamed protein product [Phaeothamnion confervicola]
MREPGAPPPSYGRYHDICQFSLVLLLYERSVYAEHLLRWFVHCIQHHRTVDGITALGPFSSLSCDLHTCCRPFHACFFSALHGITKVVSSSFLRFVLCSSLILLSSSPRSSPRLSSLIPFLLYQHQFSVDDSQDTLRTLEACRRAAGDALRRGRSVAVDATNPQAAVRRDWAAFARKGGARCRCIVFDRPKDLSFHLNAFRLCAAQSCDPALAPALEPAAGGTADAVVAETVPATAAGVAAGVTAAVAVADSMAPLPATTAVAAVGVAAAVAAAASAPAEETAAAVPGRAVPPVAIHTYFKRYEPVAAAAEGFESVEVAPFVPGPFENDEQRRLFYMFLL